MVSKAASYLKKATASFDGSGRINMVLLAVVIGLLGGLAAVGFRMLITAINELSWGEGQYTHDYISGLPAWWKILVPAIGGLIVGFIIQKFAKEAKGHGVPEVMEAVALRGGRIRPRVVFAKMLASGISIGTGGSVGREGPIVQIGAALGSTIGQWVKADRGRLQTLVGCGAAAGIAGTFNAPIAGALFAVEIILGDFGVAQFSPIVISSVAATVVSQHFLGNFPAFEVPGYSLVHPLELFAYAGLGILSGLTALGFIKTLYAFEDGFDRIKIFPPFKTMLGGATVGVIAVWVPQVFGVGYEAINQALNGTMIWHFMLALVFLKIIAVSLTIGSGGSGGVFAPSLFIGSMLGGAFGTIVHLAWPGATAGAGAYALVGMGAVVAAGTHAPITAILIIFELTNDYNIILPLMISCIVATLLATRLQRGSIYTLKLLRRGVDISLGKAVNVLEAVPVRDIMKADAVTIGASEPMLSFVSKFMGHSGGTLFVTDEENYLQGIINDDRIRTLMSDSSSLGGIVIAEDVVAEDGFPTVGPDDSLADVMRFLGSYRGEVAVVEGGKLLGVIWPQDVIERYNTEIFKRDMASSMASAVSAEGQLQKVPTLDGAVVAEVPVPFRFVGKTIRGLNIRQDFGVSILIIKQESEGGGEPISVVPDAEYTFKRADILLAMGPSADLDRLKRGRP